MVRVVLVCNKYDQVRAVYCVLCMVYCAPYAVCYVLYVLCTYCITNTVHCIINIVYCMLCTFQGELTCFMVVSCTPIVSAVIKKLCMDICSCIAISSLSSCPSDHASCFCANGGQYDAEAKDCNCTSSYRGDYCTGIRYITH